LRSLAFELIARWLTRQGSIIGPTAFPKLCFRNPVIFILLLRDPLKILSLIYIYLKKNYTKFIGRKTHRTQNVPLSAFPHLVGHFEVREKHLVGGWMCSLIYSTSLV